MAHADDRRRALKAAYIHKGLPLTDAAMAARVPYNTARNWKRAAAESGDDWDLQRNARRMTADGAAAMANEVLNDMAVEFLKTLELVRNAEPEAMSPLQRSEILVRLMDGYNKAISASAKAMPHANRLAVALDVVKFITDQAAKRAPTLREPLLALLEGAGDDLVREFGAKA